jgi:acyl-CoA synthetase (AMP-forming)/AMP-acid ligase II
MSRDYQPCHIFTMMPCCITCFQPCSGPRLARGYRNRPEQTAAAYVPNPWFEASTAALDCSDPAAAALRQHYRLAYRTSDLVVMGADAQLEYLGRADRQIKVNGVRMEISEVEAVLAGAAGEARLCRTTSFCYFAFRCDERVSRFAG